MIVPDGYIKTIVALAEGSINERGLDYVGFIDQITFGKGFMFNLVLLAKFTDVENDVFGNVQIYKDQFLTLQTAKKYFKQYCKNIKGKVKYREIRYHDKKSIIGRTIGEKKL